MRRLCRATLLGLLAIGFATTSTPAAAQGPVDVEHLFDLPSPNGCFAATMTMRRDALGRSFLYVAAKEAGLRVYDLATRTLVKTVPVAALGSLEPMNLSQSGNRLFLALGNHFDPTAQSPGLAVVDVADPAAARVLDVWRDPAARGGAGAVEIEGNTAYLAAMGNGLITLGVSSAGKLRLLSRLVPALSFPDPNPDKLKLNARGLAVRKGIVYLAFDAGGLRILDLRNRSHPVEIGRYSNPALHGKPRAYNNVVLDGSRVYVTVDYCGLEVLNVANPAAIRRVSWFNPFECPGHPLYWFVSPGHTNEITYDKQCKLLFMSAGKTDLMVVSVADPKHPVLRTSFPGVDNRIGTWGVSRSGDQLYLSYLCTLGIPFESRWSGVKAFSYDDPGCP